MRLEFKNGEVLDVKKVLSVLLNVIVVFTGTEFFVVNRHALVGKYGVKETEDE